MATTPERSRLHFEDGKLIESDNIRKPKSADAPGPQILTSDTARQAPPGFPVLYVLGISIAAAIILLGLYTFFWTRAL